MKKKNTTILIAPLHWGLGHATRCIPIINQLLKQNYKVMLGSDGAALLILRKEFPELPFIELPSYQITYPKKGSFFKLNLLLKLPKIKKAIKVEKRIIKDLVYKEKIQGIISDNRPGSYHNQIPSVYITHQINVFSGFTTCLSSKIHQNIIKKFDACWVPDNEGPLNLSGSLGHPKKENFPVTYIGPLSRMQKKESPIIFDVMVLLSGPEPQRSILEIKMMDVFLHSKMKVLLIRGVIEDETKTHKNENITIINFLKSDLLEKFINESKLIVCRSGYSTIMDLCAMKKKAFFIPTPGQYEQLYLAKLLKEKAIAPFCSQDKFTIKQLDQLSLFNGFQTFNNTLDYKNLFRLFEGE